jgi:GNAT superfamily N-acetyltransferase
MRFVVREIDREAWRLFRRHHYLSHDLSSRAVCHGCFYRGELVAFLASIPYPHRRSGLTWRASRLVVSPDWQGLGLGVRFLSSVAERFAKEGFRYFLRSSQMGMIATLRRHGDWRCVAFGLSSMPGKNALAKIMGHTRIAAAFEYRPRRMETRR